MEDLQIALDELRACYARCNSNYDQLQNKLFALLAGELTIATFIFATDSQFIPSQAYGRVFFGLGTSLLVIAIGIGFVSVSSNRWAEVPDRRRILDNSEMAAHPGKDFLLRLKEDYEETIDFCTDQYVKRTAYLDWSIRLFVAAAILLLVLKFIKQG